MKVNHGLASVCQQMKLIFSRQQPSHKFTQKSIRIVCQRRGFSIIIYTICFHALIFHTLIYASFCYRVTPITHPIQDVVKVTQLFIDVTKVVKTFSQHPGGIFTKKILFEESSSRGYCTPRYFAQKMIFTSKLIIISCVF